MHRHGVALMIRKPGAGWRKFWAKMEDTRKRVGFCLFVIVFVLFSLNKFSYVALAGLELTEVWLPLPPECWD